MRRSRKTSTDSVAKFLTRAIARSGKSQREIAREIGYDKPNIITMFKQGLTKVPLTKVGPLARALGLDPVDLLRLTMAEYAPDTWAAIEDVMGETLLTSDERVLIHAYRAARGSARAR